MIVMLAFPGIRSDMARPRRTRPNPDPSMPEIARIGRTFADRRIELRLTQQTRADLAGVSRWSVQSLERGEGSIKFGSVAEIADILGMQINAGTKTE
jgi:DNA-binding XRE family transcriptional regulator